MWDWLEDAAAEVEDFVVDAWQAVNNVVDTYVWDTTDAVAVGESWVRDTFDIPDKEGVGFVNEATERVVEVVDPVINTVKGAVGDLLDYVGQYTSPLLDQAQGTIANISSALGDVWSDWAGSAKTVVDDAVKTVKDTVQVGLNKAGDIINNISFALGVGFDAAMAAIGILPDLLVSFKKDLSAWLTFDMNEFMSTMQTMSDAMKPKAEE